MLGRRKKNRQFPTDLLEEARKWPGANVYEIAPGWDPDGEVPSGAILGAWPIDDSGNPTGEFIPNPNYDAELPPP